MKIRARCSTERVEIDGEPGHPASGPEWATWGPRLGEFPARLDQE